LGTEALEFDWDDDNAAHIARHGVTTREVENALSDDPLDMNYDLVRGEERWTSIGHTAALRVLIVVWTMRGRAIRPVTAWPAAKQVRIAYLRFKGLG
jgi:uncharacterized protein